ncbi:hypothetical protein DFQ27_002916 [Actinomortierella ambigua]|uniref:SGTA homodimerisation domain-containing protein n=1 Tax=Actinomortierella ambigua TaxID=1343610 RepID=A0A9P6Q6D7_9FUNG|nr:hypothetical protein DFQ26_002549 [Actinomortierella ambigua]KAG0261556.1 hypothetical protein DFQ27_002916 [Actinomortierella ambigua]
MADEKQKRLVFSILEFLQTSINNGTIKQDDQEGIEVAIQCIGEAFNVDVTDEEQAKELSIKPASLTSIFDVFLNTQKKVGAAKTASTSASAAKEEEKVPAKKEISEQDKANAEQLKVAGNRKVNEKDYAEAIRLYGEAIVLNPTNAVYYANRAAAYSQMGDHENAITDSIKAAEVDPSYSKAYSRLGHAYFSVGKYKDAVEAYEKGLTLEPNNATMKSSLATARSKVRDNDVAPANRAGSPAGAGAGGIPGLGGLGGGAGGMPDLAGLMNNPALMNVAQQMMQSGAFNQLLSNPAMQQMAQRMMQSGERPNMENIEEMMQDPTIAEAARGFMNNMGGQGRGPN